MKLFYSATSPYVRKCVVAAQELGLADRIERLATNAHPIQRDMSLVAHNPLGKVPALMTDAGQVLYDSRVICEYLNQLAGGALFPRGEARWPVLTLQALADGLLDAALLARYETFVRPEAHQWGDWVTGQMHKIHTALASLESQADALNDVLHGAPLHIGHIAVGCALGYLDFRFAHVDWRSAHPQVAAWFAAFGQRSSMQASAPPAA